MITRTRLSVNVMRKFPVLFTVCRSKTKLSVFKTLKFEGHPKLIFACKICIPADEPTFMKFVFSDVN